MASQMGYRGRIGNVIHYKMGNKFYSRSAPVKYEQTDASKASAQVFGRASGIGALIRKNLRSVIPNPSDRKMHTRLVSEIFEWLRLARDAPASDNNQPSFQTLYSLNPKAPSLNRRWRVEVQVANPSPDFLQITIPAFIPNEAFVAPPGAVEVICRLASVSIDIANIKANGKHVAEIIYPLDDKEIAGQIFTINLPTPEASLVVTALSLVYTKEEYDTKNNITNNSFLPAKIIHAIYI